MRVLVLSPNEPAFYGLGTIFFPPRLQRLLVATAGLDDLAGVRHLICETKILRFHEPAKPGSTGGSRAMGNRNDCFGGRRPKESTH